MSTKIYILKTPNLLSVMGEFNATAKLRPIIVLVSIGSMTPSSQSLSKNNSENMIKQINK